MNQICLAHNVRPRDSKTSKTLACPGKESSKDCKTPAKRHLYPPIIHMTIIKIPQSNKGYQEKGTPGPTRNVYNNCKPQILPASSGTFSVTQEKLILPHKPTLAEGSINRSTLAAFLSSLTPSLDLDLIVTTSTAGTGGGRKNVYLTGAADAGGGGILTFNTPGHVQLPSSLR